MRIEDFNLDVMRVLPDMVGKAFYFRTVTYHWVGRVAGVFGGKFLYLTDASWIAESGRFMQAIRDGALNEVEPVGHAFVNLDTVTDFIPWVHELPTEQR
jgi:hypothetical protein